MPSRRARQHTITVTAPCRADLAGGTMDIWPLYLFHPGARTVNFALSIKTRCEIMPETGKGIHLRSLDTGRQDNFRDLAALLRAKKYKHGLAAQLVRFFRPQGGFTLETYSASPAGAGISGSSALMIATTAALAKFTGRKLGKEEMRVIAQNVECQLIQVPTGCQDYYPALYGGVSAIHLREDGFHREGIGVDLDEFDRRFVIAYTGAPRQSGINNWEVFKAHVNGDKKVFRNFEAIAAIAEGMHHALAKNQWNEVARLVREEWKLRRTNAPGISTPLIEKLIAVAAKNGGRAAKVCGAGGGGCVLFIVDPNAKERVQHALRSAGGQVLQCSVSRRGVSISSS
jgi:D-glycero-alpha-D-manno-heptose-7-phosphate kinase